MPTAAPGTRLAVRAVILDSAGRLLLVNAYRGRRDLWCAPGGGVEAHHSLPDNLHREVMEETGLDVIVGAPCLVNEFHDPRGSFHQIEIYFRCVLAGDPAGALPADWSDPEGVVSWRVWVGRDQISAFRVKPDGLVAAAWGRPGEVLYDPLEQIIG
jgi:ADP-ribose pyrophosphatase YjhB (NUDIX family)